LAVTPTPEPPVETVEAVTPTPEPPVETVEAAPTPEPTAEDTLLRLWRGLVEGEVAVKRGFVEVDIAVKRDLSVEEVGPTGYLDRTPMDGGSVQAGVDPWGRKYIAVRLHARSNVPGSDGRTEKTGVVTFFERYDGGGMWTWGSAQFVHLPFEPRLSLGDAFSVSHLIAGGAVKDGPVGAPRLKLRLAEPEPEAQPEPQPEAQPEAQPEPEPSLEELHIRTEHRAALRDVRRAIPRGQGHAGRAVALITLVDEHVGGKDTDRARALRGLLAACDRNGEDAPYALRLPMSRIISSMIRDGQGFTAALAVKCYAEEKETAPRRVVLPLSGAPLEATLFTCARRGVLRKAPRDVTPLYGEDAFRVWYAEGQDVYGVAFGSTADGSLLFLSDSGHLILMENEVFLMGNTANESPHTIWEGVQELLT
jgi:hypothetical protein